LGSVGEAAVAFVVLEVIAEDVPDAVRPAVRHART